MHRQEAAHRRIRPAKLLAHQREAERVHPCAAVLLRHRAGEEAQLGHARDQLAREDTLLIGLTRQGSKLLAGEGARHLLDAPLLLS